MAAKPVDKLSKTYRDFGIMKYWNAGSNEDL
jgi:hypothetical protein